MAGLKELPETAEQRRVRHLLAEDRAEHLIPPEALAQGDFADVTVVADDQSQATVKRNRMTNPMYTLYEHGSINEDQYDAAMEIARVAEEITRTIGLRSASLEARVDNSGSAKNLLIESLSRVQLEATYNAWRSQLPMPRRMIIDLALGSGTIAASARRYRMRRAKVRKILIKALDSWIGLREKVREQIEASDVEAMHLRVGGGTLK